MLFVYWLASFENPLEIMFFFGFRYVSSLGIVVMRSGLSLGPLVEFLDWVS